MTLLDLLKQLHERMQDKKNWTKSGICVTIREQLNTEELVDLWWDDPGYSERMYQLFCTWPKFSGHSSFPLPGGCEAYDIWALNFNLAEDQKARMWDRVNSPYAALRWELLEWMIAELEKQQ